MKKEKRKRTINVDQYYINNIVDKRSTMLSDLSFCINEFLAKCNEKEKTVVFLIMEGRNVKDIRRIAKVDGYVYKKIIKKIKKFLETGDI
jgi:hypothetical protein